MENPISLQLYQAGIALLFGFTAGLLYDILKTIRQCVRYKRASTFFDVVYWLILSLALFTQTMTAGQGILRIFMLLLNIGGGMLYFLSLSASVRLVLRGIAEKIMLFSTFLTKPVRQIWSKGKKFAGKRRKDFQNRVKHYIIKTNYCLKVKKRKKKEQSGGEINAQKKGQYLYETSRIGSRRLRLDHADLAARPDSKRGRSKSGTRTSRGRTRAGKRHLRERD